MARFVADENIALQLIELLRRLGHSVVSISESSPQVSDATVLAQAVATNAILLTADKDFGELAFHQHHELSGVVLLRLHGLTPEARAEVVTMVIREFGEQLDGAFTVISPGQVRIRPRNAPAG